MVTLNDDNCQPRSQVISHGRSPKQILTKKTMAEDQEGDYFAWFEDQRTRRRHSMDMHLTQTPVGGITGNGSDFVGSFVLTDGVLEAKPLGFHYSVRFTKRYSTHNVIYDGLGVRDGPVLMAAGRWMLEDCPSVHGNWELRQMIAPVAA